MGSFRWRLRSVNSVSTWNMSIETMAGRTESGTVVICTSQFVAGALAQRLDNRSLVIRRVCFVLSIDNRFERIKGKANSSMETVINECSFLFPLFATFCDYRCCTTTMGDKYRLLPISPLYILVTCPLWRRMSAPLLLALLYVVLHIEEILYGRS